jgi:hypothetical protein
MRFDLILGIEDETIALAEERNDSIRSKGKQ